MMEELKQKIQALINEAAAGAAFGDLMERFCNALRQHPEALGQLAGRYRLQTTDTQVNVAFELAENSLTLLDGSERVDATISAKEADLLAVLKRELNPMAAMFTGKLRVQGSMQVLGKFAQLLA